MTEELVCAPFPRKLKGSENQQSWPGRSIISPLFVVPPSRYNAQKLKKDHATIATPYVPNPAMPSTFGSSKHQLEDVVENEIASGTIWEELKSLAVVHGSLFIIHLDNILISHCLLGLRHCTYQKRSSDQYQDPARLSRRLGIESRHGMLDFLEWEFLGRISKDKAVPVISRTHGEFLDNTTGACNRITFESQHRVVALADCQCL